MEEKLDERIYAKEVFANFINDLYASNQQIIDSNDEVYRKYKDLVNFYDVLNKQNADFSNLTIKQKDRFNLLIEEFFLFKNKVKKEISINNALSKMKEIKEEPLNNVTEYETEKGRIINAKHFSPEQKEEIIEELDKAINTI